MTIVLLFCIDSATKAPASVQFRLLGCRRSYVFECLSKSESVLYDEDWGKRILLYPDKILESPFP
jgi:hypothetical protein